MLINAVVNSFHHTARRSTDQIITDSGKMSTDCLKDFSVHRAGFCQPFFKSFFAFGDRCT